MSEYATLLEVPERPIAEWTRVPNDGELFRDGTDLYMGDGSTAAASLTAFGGGGGGGGVTDHGALTGLGDDDHTQYHNDTRGDARYARKSNNLSDLASASTARTNLGLGTLATQNGTFSGTSSGTNTGDQDLSPYQTIASLAADVRAVVLTGLSLATNQAIAAGDSILQALGYLQAQITDRYTKSQSDARYRLASSVIEAALSANFDTTSTSYVDVTGLSVALAANSRYIITVTGSWTSSNNSGQATFGLNLPAGATFTMTRFMGITSSAISSTMQNTVNQASNVPIGTANAVRSLLMVMQVTTAATAGNAQVRLASNNVAYTATCFKNTHIKAESY